MEQQQQELINVPLPDQPKDYHGLPGLSNSRLKLLRKNPTLFKRAMEFGWEQETKAHHIEGDMIDKVLLDYNAFEKNYVEQTWETPSSPNQQEFARLVVDGESLPGAYDKCYKRSHKPDTLKRKSKELYDELKKYIDYLRSDDTHKTPYTASQKEMIMSIQQSAFNHPWIPKLLNHPKKQTHVVFQATLLGEPFKCEVDLYIDDKVIWNIDLKSTYDHLSSFYGEYRRYGYAAQQALYYKIIRAWRQSQGLPYKPIKTVCIAVSKKDPYGAGLFDIHPKLLVEGWQWIKESTQIYKFHDKHGFDYLPRTYEKGMELITPYKYNEDLLPS